MPTARACSFKGIKRIIKSRGEVLHSAGEAVQEIVETLADTGEAKDYEKAVKALNDYFIPKVNSTYQNPLFHSMEEQDGETVAQFVTRLSKWSRTVITANKPRTRFMINSRSNVNDMN